MDIGPEYFEDQRNAHIAKFMNKKFNELYAEIERLREENKELKAEDKRLRQEIMHRDNYLKSVNLLADCLLSF